MPKISDLLFITKTLQIIFFLDLEEVSSMIKPVLLDLQKTMPEICHM
jgi:hypothetical protein